MKTLTCVLLAVVAFGFLVRPSCAADEVDKNLTKQRSDILTEWKKIAPGTTRTELLKVFTTEGGLSTATRRTFVHRVGDSMKLMPFVLQKSMSACI